MGHPPIGGKVTRIELTGISMVTQPLANQPHNVKLSPEGHLLYMADQDGRALIVADPATLEELNRVELPAKPHDLAVDAVGSVWITLIGEDRFGRFQSGTMKPLATGRSPHDLIAVGLRTGGVGREPDS
ncbi:MAG: hypothetical protein O6705_03640, partial [Actinobacteria bacterium]|nr:hypothetical protein [Actinomycetota bacterium]